MTTSPACPVPATCFNNFTCIFLEAAGATVFFFADKAVDAATSTGGLAGGIKVAGVNDQDCFP